MDIVVLTEEYLRSKKNCTIFISINSSEYNNSTVECIQRIFNKYKELLDEQQIDIIVVKGPVRIIEHKNDGTSQS